MRKPTIWYCPQVPIINYWIWNIHFWYLIINPSSVYSSPKLRNDNCYNNNVLSLPRQYFKALMLVGPSKCLIQIIQIKLNWVKHPIFAGGKPAGYLHAWSRIWTWDYREQIQLAVRAGLELGASKLQVQRSNHSATLPPTRKVSFWPKTWSLIIGLWAVTQ